MGKLVKRSDKLAFYGVPGGTPGADPQFGRMKGFTEISHSKNAIEYSRQYVDELFEQTDVVGYSPSISYAFDEYTSDEPQMDIINITNQEDVGSDAVRKILIVDISGGVSPYPAVMREFAVIPDSEGGSMEAYTYSGTFKAKGEKVFGTAVLSNDDTIATFTPTP